MIEIITNPNIQIPIWHGITFFTLASATVTMSLFIYNRKKMILINSVILYLLFFIAFSQFLIINDKIVEALKHVKEPEKLSILNALALIGLGFILIVISIISLVKTTKGFKDARNDIIASVKALIPPYSTWKPEQGLTDSIIKKFRITKAEQAAANLVLLGKSNKEIAYILKKTVGTVETQLKSVYQKAEVPGRYALIALTAQSITEDYKEKSEN